MQNVLSHLPQSWQLGSTGHHNNHQQVCQPLWPFVQGSEKYNQILERLAKMDHKCIPLHYSKSRKACQIFIDIVASCLVLNWNCLVKSNFGCRSWILLQAPDTQMEPLFSHLVPADKHITSHCYIDFTKI